jgi:SpoVK/Ycf46/Vps4 family AAA+-type ATPase
MARADLMCDIIQYGLNQDRASFRKSVEAMCAEERAKQHGVLADRLEKMLRNANAMPSGQSPSLPTPRRGDDLAHMVIEKIPEKSLRSLFLPRNVADGCAELIAEQMRADLLRSYGAEPRNRVLLTGPPGNGKTSLAEAIAEALILPLLTVRYESLIGSCLGETASRLKRLFDLVKTRQCVLFFDEFETLGKERGDEHDAGDIKRIVSILLLQIDSLPSYVVLIAATNHESLLDHGAWRRFQLRLVLPPPSAKELLGFFRRFEETAKFDFGMELSTLAKTLSGTSFAEAEEFALSVYRQYVLKAPAADTKEITRAQLKIIAAQANSRNHDEATGQ